MHRCWLILLTLYPICLFGQDGNFFSKNYLFQGKTAEHPIMDVLQDRQGFMWLATYAGLVRYDGKEEKYYTHDPADSLSLRDNVLTALAQNQEGQLWVGSMNNGIYLFDPATERFINYRHIPGSYLSLPSNRINRIHVSRKGEVWVTTERGIARFDTVRSTFITVPATDRVKPYAYAITENEDGGLLFGGFNGIDRWSYDKKSLERIVAAPSPLGPVKSITTYSDGWLIGTQKAGIHQLKQLNDDWQLTPLSADLPQELTEADVWKIVDLPQGGWIVVCDKALFQLQPKEHGFHASRYHLSRELRFLSAAFSTDSVLWIGTNDGINSLIPRHKIFHHVSLQPPGSRAYSSSYALSPHTDKEILVGSNAGLIPFSIDEQRIKFVPDRVPEAFRNNTAGHIPALYSDQINNSYFASVEGFGENFSVYRYRRQQNELIPISANHSVLEEYPTRFITGDEAGNIWLASDYGLLKYLPTRDSLKIIRPAGPAEFRATFILPDTETGVWVGTAGAGLWRYDPLSDNLQAASTLPLFAASPLNKTINTLAQDERGNIWIGSAGGLSCYDHQNNQLKHFTEKNGLRENGIENILPLDSKTVWFTSRTFLSRLDLNTFDISHYGENDGIRTHIFTPGTSLKGQQGRLYFGGANGITVFRPADIRHNNYPPEVVFTRLDLYNQEVEIGGPDGILPKGLPDLTEIVLRYEQNIFTVHFSALSYAHSGQNQYATRLEGFESDWQELGTRSQLTYTNLDPGTYRLYVKAANHDNTWNDTPSLLTIKVLPPWYNTWTAWVIYGLLFVSALLLIYRFQVNRKLALTRAKHLQEIDAIRTSFYTNITHEFRTPLTLIQGPVELALQDDYYSLNQSRLNGILDNCRRLLKLIDRLLQLNQLEDGRMIFRYSHGNIQPLLRTVFDSFRESAQKKQIDFRYLFSDDALSMDYDQDKLSDIVNNLLSNALKFTPAGGRVLLQTNFAFTETSKKLVLDVSDNGPAIPLSERERIFERFYRAGNQSDQLPTIGSGVGLSLSRELARLLGGDLTLLAKHGPGNTFRLRLPVRTDYLTNPENISPASHSAVTASDPELPGQVVSSLPLSAPLVLIVEDHPEMATYLADCVQATYRVQLAQDGAAGLVSAREYLPDLIISDVMMPRMDGFELCSHLKTDLATSHIPIILLTARVDRESRLRGLGQGADAYLPKPFDAQELRIRCQQLLQLRTKLAHHYHRVATGRVTDVESKPAQLAPSEYQFILRTKTIINDHLADENFGTQQLAEVLSLDRTQLYRKLRDLANLTPSDLIRTLRLQHAEVLLADLSLSVAEVAYASGFRDPDYFSRVFRKVYQVTPTVFRAKS